MSQRHPSTLSLLALPPEIRLQIYAHLLSPSSKTKSITIRSLFIRTNFRNTFMSNTPSNLPTNLLLICKQITQEFLPLLYGIPRFHCPCRTEQLASQIGAANFSRIRHLSVDADDLAGIVSAVTGNSNGTTAGPSYTDLETLEAEGYRAISLTTSASRPDLVDALKLCHIAQQILASHPILTILGQDSAVWNGGADAVDESYARVRWRFVRCEAALSVDEHALDVNGAVQVLEDLMRKREREDVVAQTWVQRGGDYVQYPYLAA